MRSLEAYLEKTGFEVHNLRYASTDHTPDELVADLYTQLLGCCSKAARLHFVTHSLGGILARALIAQHPLENLGRVVMLAPPNHGSELADALADSALFEAAFGPTAPQLGTGPESLPNRLPPPSFELGVIAGTRSVNPFSGFLIPGESDGTVSVASTQLSGMTDFIALPVSHTFIMSSEQTADQVVEFLRRGRFKHSAPSIEDAVAR
jgi:pimeloyl-ACP methyl ester carboxylesterase